MSNMLSLHGGALPYIMRRIPAAQSKPVSSMQHVSALSLLIGTLRASAVLALGKLHAMVPACA